MGQSTLWNTVWQLFSLTQVYMQLAVVTVSQLCFPAFSEVNESKAAQGCCPCFSSLPLSPFALFLAPSLAAVPSLHPLYFLKFESDDVPHNLELYLMPTVRGIPFSFHYTSLALNSAQAFSSPSVCIIPTPIYEKLNTVPLQADVIVLHLRHLFTPRAFFWHFYLPCTVKPLVLYFLCRLTKNCLAKWYYCPL